MRSFVKIDFATEQVPDATTLLKFWHLIEKRQEVQGDPCLSSKEYRINRRRRSVQRMPSGFIDWEREIERRKSSVRSKVEHPFLIIKRYFGFAKTVYRGLAKNTHRLRVLFASANLLLCARAGRRLLPA
jgi:IS5 family transposase